MSHGLAPITVTSANDGQGAKPYVAKCIMGATPLPRALMPHSDPALLYGSRSSAVERVSLRGDDFMHKYEDCELTETAAGKGNQVPHQCNTAPD